jgi:glycosyltransferase involved in cell wall biosynthesis
MPTAGSKRIALVTDEILGLTRSSGAATANTFLSLALADLGHKVEILYPAPMPPEGLVGSWRREYRDRGIRIRSVEPFPHPVSPTTATVTCALERQLQRDPPDVVIADDRYGTCYAAVRSRSLALGFRDTLFIIYCHGTTAWISDAQGKIRRWPASFEVEALERAAIELADAVVSPSAYMLDWMRDRGWRLPRAVVAPLLTRSAVDPRAVQEPVTLAPIQRIAFFGRLEERKGLRPFIDALNAMDSKLLAGLELLFVGKPTPAWNVERVRTALSPAIEAALARLRFETELDQPEALELLREPGTLAIMPSLLDNSPMVIYECLEHGIPFLASSAGGGPELVADADRERSFVEPTADAMQQRLTAMLSGREECSPANPAFDPEQTLSAWQSAIESPPVRHRPEPRTATISAIVRRRGRQEQLERCLQALREQTRPPDDVVVIDADGDIRGAKGDFLLLLEDADQLDTDCLETLLRAQAASDADVVTCAFRSGDDGEVVSLFVGDARELGVIANHYGLAGLYRRPALEEAEGLEKQDWLRLASLSLAGARIVSVPRPLVRSARRAERASTSPELALAVINAFEHTGPPQLRGLPTLAASLAARVEQAPARPSLGQRVRWILTNEGGRGFLRRAKRRVSDLAVGPSRSSAGFVRAASPQLRTILRSARARRARRWAGRST